MACAKSGVAWMAVRRADLVDKRVWGEEDAERQLRGLVPQIRMVSWRRARATSWAARNNLRIQV
jgi:hypothetical protein